MKSTSDLNEILQISRKSLSSFEKKALALEDLKVITPSSFQSDKLTELKKNLIRYTTEYKNLTKDEKISLFSQLIMQKKECLAHFQKLSLKEANEKRVLEFIHAENEKKRLAVLEIARKKKEEEDKIAEAKLQKELEKVHLLTLEELRNTIINTHINHIKTRYSIRDVNFSCAAEGATLLEKAKNYEKALSIRAIDDINACISQALLQLAILRYQINLIENEIKIQILLPRPPDRMEIEEHYIGLTKWAKELQIRCLLILEKEAHVSNKTIENDEKIFVPDLRKKPTEISMTFFHKKIDKEPQNYIYMLMKLISKILSHPNALSFWNRQAWFGDKITYDNAKNYKIPTSVNAMIKAIQNGETLDVLQNQAALALTKKSFFCKSKKPLLRSTKTHDFYLILASMKFSNNKEIDISIRNLTNWVRKNKVEIYEATSVMPACF